jgi:hypothetical protein
MTFFINNLILGQTDSSSDSTCGVFGIACSIDGAPEKSMLKTILLANHSNKTQLLKWISSDDPQDQIHGYIGLYLMMRNSFHLSNAEKKQMKKVENSEIYVEYCSGCDYGKKEKINVLLAKKRLKGFYSWYKNFGWSGMKNIPYEY